LRASADSSAMLTTNAAPRLLWHIGTVPALSVNEPEAWKHHRPARKASDERMKSVLAAKGLRRRLSRPPGVHCEGGGQRGIRWAARWSRQACRGKPILPWLSLGCWTRFRTNKSSPYYCCLCRLPRSPSAGGPGSEFQGCRRNRRFAASPRGRGRARS